MKFKIAQAELLKAIQIVQRGLPSHSTLPVLNGILFQVEKPNIFLTTNNLEITVQQRINAEIISPGKVVISARLISDLVRNLPSTKIEFESKTDEELSLSWEHSQFKLKCLPPSDFPKTPEAPLKTGESFKLKGKNLISSVRQVAKAASRDESRPILNGILLNLNQDNLTLAATDSYRLAIRIEKPNPKKALLSGKVVVPTRTLEEVAKITNSEEEVQISFSKNQIFFNLKDSLITSRLIEGEFPDYGPLLPSEWQTRVEVDKESFESAVKRVLILTKDSPLKLKLQKGLLKIFGESPETGEALEEMEVSFQGFPLEIAFNGQYLLDGLFSQEEEKVFLECTGPLKPALLKGPPEADQNFLYLIMPIRT